MKRLQEDADEEVLDLHLTGAGRVLHWRKVSTKGSNGMEAIFVCLVPAQFIC